MNQLTQQLLNPTTSLSQWVANFYTYSLGLAGLFVFGSIVYAAILYTVSAGKPAMQEEAKDQIRAAFFGLVLLLGAYLILFTINPSLVNLKDPGQNAPTTVPPVRSSGTNNSPFQANPLLDGIDKLQQNIKNDEAAENYLQKLLADPNLTDEQKQTYATQLEQVQLLKAYDQAQLQGYKPEDIQKAQALVQLKALDEQIRNAQTPQQKGALQKQYNDIYFQYKW